MSLINPAGSRSKLFAPFGHSDGECLITPIINHAMSDTSLDRSTS